MSEIKFRAWDIHREKMIYPEDFESCFCFIGNILTILDLTYSEDDDYPKLDCKIMQYTGLHDKNGTEIYEGDILRSHGNDKDIAEVLCGEFPIIDVETFEIIDYVKGWHYKPITTDALSKVEPFCLTMPLTDFYIKRCEFEVIGNIYENPELLER